MRQVPRLEIDVAKSCNLTCAGCNHLSPLFKKGFADPAELKEDLGILSQQVHAKTIRVLGGEPLLHPRILEVLDAVRGSGIGDEVHVLTNGTLLERMSEEFWKKIDLADVSVYPGVDVPTKELEEQRPGRVLFRSCTSFYETFSTRKNEDPELVQRIVQGCKILDFCIGLVDRKFYRCMRSAYISAKVPHPELVPGCDGLDLRGRDLEGRMEAYFKELPRSCKFCTGSSGRRFPHERPSHEGWLGRHNRPISEMVR